MSIEESIKEIKIFFCDDDISDIQRCVKLTSNEVKLSEEVIFGFIRDILFSESSLIFSSKFLGIEIKEQSDIIELLRTIIITYRKNNGYK